MGRGRGTRTISPIVFPTDYTAEHRGRARLLMVGGVAKPSVPQSVGMLFFREDFEPRTASKTQEVLMESDCVVFIDGSLTKTALCSGGVPVAVGNSPRRWDIAATAKDRTRVGGLARRNDVKRAAADLNLSRPLCQGPLDRRLPQPPLELTAPKDPAPRLWCLGL